MIFNVPSLVKAGAWVEITDPNMGGANWRGLRDPRLIDALAIHHSVTNPRRNLMQEISEIWQIHKNNGWGGIGYNFVISTEEVAGGRFAKVAMIGDLASIRAHTPNTKGAFGMQAGYGNFYLAGIVFVEQLHINNPTDAQLRSAHELAKELLFNENERLPKLGEWWDMHPYKTFDPTECSGKWDEYQKDGIITPPSQIPSTGWNGSIKDLDDASMLFTMKRGIPLFDLKTGLEVTGSGSTIHITKKTKQAAVNMPDGKAHTMYLPIDRVKNNELFGFKEEDLFNNMQSVKEPAVDPPKPVYVVRVNNQTTIYEGVSENDAIKAYNGIELTEVNHYAELLKDGAVLSFKKWEKPLAVYRVYAGDKVIYEGFSADEAHIIFNQTEPSESVKIIQLMSDDLVVDRKIYKEPEPEKTLYDWVVDLIKLITDWLKGWKR